jgi:DnaJ homolog subfamily C member 3
VLTVVLSQSNGKRTQEFCEESLELNPDSFYGLLYRAKTLLQKEEYERCIELLNKASEARPDKRETVQPLMEKAQIALKRSKTKDYYKVLGVAQDADERQIKSAYRKLSKQFHPDKAKHQGLSKDDAEKKMATINEAYDRGDDPNAQGQQNPFHGSPFGNGHPFMFQQGGSQHFQFKFQGGPGGFPFG